MELSDGKPLVVAVPKISLGILAAHEGSTTALSQRLGVDRPSLSKWISGQREMPNDQVLHVASRLNISPLWLLDLNARSDAHEAPDAMATRAGLLEDLAALRELEAGHDVPGYRYQDLIAIHGHEGAAQALRDNLQHVRGDYRDLAALIRDAASYYSTTTRPDYLLQQMFEAWQLHGWDSQG